MNRVDPGDERNLKPFPSPDQRRPTPYHFNAEELKVLRDCNRESFFQRCIPLSTFLGLGTYYGVQTGFLKPNVRYGATPKVVVAVIIGYFVGKISYQTKCAEKLMQLPNSPIGELLRRKRQGLPHESLDPGFNPGLSLTPFGGMNSTEVYSDVDTKLSTDIDTPRPELEASIYEEEMPPVQRKTTTYDELRKKNREEYQSKRSSLYRSPPAPTDLPQGQPVPAETEFPDVPSSPGISRRNKYGDLME
ncbi:OCIA domain-containing protein 1 isoform X2 [Agrilus planipennis]|uniref:OCIA domain-containing protein 1 isoform X2 n=1 Tax=Agrilus planipennis TaxID=224129 RepID=A0A1W4XW83_AGRPL|nr:OCIA domain-containing protein 1 isoform X2 [Agrilus planipennis]